MGASGFHPLPVTPLEQQPNMLQMLAGVQGLKNAQQNNVALQQENEQRALALKDQQAMTAAMHEWDGKDLNGLTPLMVKHGASANAVIGLKGKILEQQEKYSTIAKNDADTGQKNLESMKMKNDAIVGGINSLKDVPDEQLVQAIPGVIQSLTQQGALSPQEAQQASGLAQQGDPAAIRKQLSIFSKLHSTASQQMDQALKDAEKFKDTQQGSEAQANTSLINSKASWFKNNGLTPGVSPEEASLADWLKKNPGKGASDYQVAMKKIVPAYNFNLQNGGATGQNGQPSATAQAIANGQMKWSEAVSPRTPLTTKNQLMSEVLKLKPDFDTAQFGIEAKTAEKAASGAWADTRVAYNTALDHSKQLLSALDALQNGDTQKLNQLRNYFKTEFGSPDVPTYDAIANAYNHEVTAVVSKGHITDTEVKTGGAVLPDKASPQQIRSVVSAYNGLMQSKRDELDKQIKAGAGNKADRILNQDKGRAIAVQAPNGKTYHFSSQADAEAFKARAGIQ